MSINNKEIIKKLYQDFDMIQSNFVNRPVLGASRWYMTDYKVLDNKGMIEVNMEDGHISNKVVVQYIKTSDSFMIMKERLN